MKKLRWSIINQKPDGCPPVGRGIGWIIELEDKAPRTIGKRGRLILKPCYS